MPNATGEYVKLEQRLVLLSWLNSLLGFKSNKELLADLKEADEGFDPSGRSFIYHRLAGRGEKVLLPLSQLATYDDNIRGHVAAINARREEPIVLRYFQYLAVLYAEILLDFYFNRRRTLVADLNGYVTSRNATAGTGEAHFPPYRDEDLTKLAFWMATGSGKTLIMHINYRQFLHYNNQELDNLLLITPNEGLTEQHLEEMRLSGIPCARFSLQESGLRLGNPDTVRVIEITKLVEQRRGEGVSVPVEAFEGNNLILVDEGHKGSGGEVWRRYRDALGSTGFTFEYSATFGQALSAARSDSLTAEYGKAIAFDYSYRYFYRDGFGKDFHILNIEENTAEDQTDLLLLGNLLSFFEQQRLFEQEAVSLKPYNLEKPLWVFVGSTVSVYTEGGTRRSDVLTVARFLHRFLENKQGWVTKGLRKLLDGRTGLVDIRGEDVFAERFAFVRGQEDGPEALYRSILAEIFHVPSSGILHVTAIRGSDGELGLKAGGAEEYFGLIYIGDTPAFRRLLESDDAGIVIEEDAISASLFNEINTNNSSISVLIGAKKFMEGWNSWRVSSMGLLNIGRREGSQIIQLFGRGVRLKGLGHTLKRSSALDGRHPAQIRLLETLNVFAVRANYMGQFKGYLEKEGVEPEGFLEIPVAIRPNRDFLSKGLLVPELPEDASFVEDCDIALQPDEAAKVVVDLTVKVQSMASSPGGLAVQTAHSGTELVLSQQYLDLVDWEAVYFDLLTFKESRGFRNLLIQMSALRAVMEHVDPRLYSLVADESLQNPASFLSSRRVTRAVAAVLRRYAEKYYRICQERWDTDNMAFTVMDASHPNFHDYTVKLPRSEEALVLAIEKLIGEATQLYRQDVSDLPTIHFDRHLYQPLLVQRGDKITSTPPGLNPAEQRFVADLRSFVREEAGRSLASKEVFLLRNLSRGKGVGFFENAGFYPDFILWIRQGGKQRIVFVEPHGMRHEKSYWIDEKVRLHERLKHLSRTFASRSGHREVEMDSFVISATSFDELRDYYGDGSWSLAQFERVHILFFDRDGGYISKLFA